MLSTIWATCVLKRELQDGKMRVSGDSPSISFAHFIKGKILNGSFFFKKKIHASKYNEIQKLTSFCHLCLKEIR